MSRDGADVRAVMQDPALRSALKLPHAAPGQRIGLLGGTFDPPHKGHLTVSLMALRRLELDAIWWLVTPGNPLKDHAPDDLGRRIVAARAMADHPQIHVTAIEATLKTRFTADTLAILSERLPGVNLVWLMGGDNLRQFHRWRHWRRIADLMPIAVYDRPGSTFIAPAAPAAQALRFDRLMERDAARLPTAAPPAWVYLHGPRVALSSTQLRARRNKSAATS
ncbi:nicotinate-nucleotide adenylyltransferase [Kaistia terrae]|uniref:Probable nicotinate-nucleotide adenylyltransferase n=1 Tax=Kaistia terrae TaxID=537017 RepID=A0ABW0PZ30_9HYPH|nr:nicotinate-nucleotide adenylyltransferase [Kaistia terrae]MCX5580957.1 nicotinate-nucleotide adenylyltransferase [Kaistia terrae]